MSEKNLNFDQPVERRGTHSLKYDFAEERGRKKDIFPLWVADMDFKTSSFVQEALIRQAEHGIYGYTESDHCLLYTSPSPRDRQKSRMPSSA